MLGIDLTNISRFKNPSETLIKKILHKEEIVEYNAVENKEKYLAARWAIKEALYKADNQLFEFSKIKIVKQDRKYLFPGYKISTSTEDNYYIAIVEKEKHEC